MEKLVSLCFYTLQIRAATNIRFSPTYILRISASKFIFEFGIQYVSIWYLFICNSCEIFHVYSILVSIKPA